MTGADRTGKERKMRKKTGWRYWSLCGERAKPVEARWPSMISRKTLRKGKRILETNAKIIIVLQSARSMAIHNNNKG